MEELLSELNGGSDGIGLNIVASIPKPVKLRKSKNGNKYDKRRNKSAKARGEVVEVTKNDSNYSKDSRKGDAKSNNESDAKSAR